MLVRGASVYSDADGYYVLTSSSTSPVRLQVYSGYYVSGWWNGSEITQDCSQASDSIPSTGQTIINMSIEKADSISGSVKDATGVPHLWKSLHTIMTPADG